MLFYHWLFPTRALQSPHPSPLLSCITILLPLSPSHSLPPLKRDCTFQVVLKVNCHQVLLKERNYQHNDES